MGFDDPWFQLVIQSDHSHLLLGCQWAWSGLGDSKCPGTEQDTHLDAMIQKHSTVILNHLQLYQEFASYEKTSVRCRA